jgi:hypothetical protein
VSRLPRAAIRAAALGLALGCQTHAEPAERCQERPDGGSVEIECEPDPSAGWSDQALDEAEESMEERRPGGRR